MTDEMADDSVPFSTGHHVESLLQVSNIPVRWRDEDLLKEFSSYGKVSFVEVIWDEFNSQEFGFVAMQKGEDAEKAMAGMTGRVFDGKMMEVNKVTARVHSEKMRPPVTVHTAELSKRLHVSNIPFNWKNGDLLQEFSKFGPVIEARIIFNERGSKGFGYVVMGQLEDAEKAVIEMMGKITDGKTMRVNSVTADFPSAQANTSDPLKIQAASESNFVCAAVAASNLPSSSVRAVRKRKICSICTRDIEITQIKLHVASHYQYVPYTCGECGYSARYSMLVSNHFRTKHGHMGEPRINYEPNIEIENQIDQIAANCIEQ